MVALPEALAAEHLYKRAMGWRDKVQQILQSDEVRAMQGDLAEYSIMSRLVRSQSGYVLQRGINTICLLTAFSLVFFIEYFHFSIITFDSVQSVSE